MEYGSSATSTTSTSGDTMESVLDVIIGASEPMKIYNPEDREKPESEFNPGDVVELKSGGHKMTIETVFENDDEELGVPGDLLAECTYYNEIDGYIASVFINTRALKKV
ncbi:MAG: DUF2158 domain-containing protein [Candidatus Nanoarchaeia archaeon]|nr:DUF2158 domain-containing protein [Candidatus Nanoarchaeia archaeon]